MRQEKRYGLPPRQTCIPKKRENKEKEKKKPPFCRLVCCVYYRHDTYPTIGLDTTTYLLTYLQ